MKVCVTERRRRQPRALVALLCAVLLLPACSIRKMAVRTIADALSQGSSQFGTDNDPQLIKDALPFGLKTLESLLAEMPRHRPLLRTLASGFTSYAVGFILPDVRMLESVEFARAQQERVRARNMLLRARDYGIRALEVPYPGFGEALRKDAEAAAARAVRADVPDLYWTAAAWGMAISNGKDQVDLIGDIPIVEALARRVLALDEAWDDGAIHEMMIAFESRGEAGGGSFERARTHYARAMELAKGRRITPLVSLAENVSLEQGNRKEFEALLDQALEYDPDTHLPTRLVNILAQRRARLLKDQVGDLFLEDK